MFKIHSFIRTSWHPPRNRIKRTYPTVRRPFTSSVVETCTCRASRTDNSVRHWNEQPWDVSSQFQWTVPIVPGP